MTVEVVAQRSCGCPLPGSVPGELGQGFEQVGLVEGVPACGKGHDLNDRQGPFQRKLFCDFTIPRNGGHSGYEEEVLL